MSIFYAMKRRGHQPILSLLIILVIGSCVEPYAPPVVRQNTNYLVVDAMLNSSNNAASVILSRTIPLYSKEFKRELNAIISIEDEQGNGYTLTEKGNGLYEKEDLPVDIQKQYRLRILTADNQEYFSKYIPVKNTPEIDSVFWLAESDGIRVYVNTHDDSGSTRYYKWRFHETWEYNSVFFSSFKLVDGEVFYRLTSEYLDRCWSENLSEHIIVGSSNKFSKDIISHFPLVFVPKGTKLSRKYSILVQQQAITEEAYEYWLQLQQTTENLGGLFDPMPYQVNGNIYNASNPSEPILGFFSAGSTTEHRMFLEAIYELPQHLKFDRHSPCLYDSIPLGDIPNQAEQTLLITTYGMVDDEGNPEGYLTSETSCIDCRYYGGTTKKPPYWE